ncbi:hypothetical protein [Silanimonas sp.]|uniref:hypothetical protein n=1 Tax=Silanimonas sp. TaxID=1929290 RepID=UPI0037CC469D
MKHRANRLAFIAALTACALSGLASAQEAEPSWIKCERTESAPHSDSDNSNFMLDPISFYYRVDGATVVRMWNDNGVWREDSRCVGPEFDRSTMESFVCAVNDNTIQFTYSHVTFRGKAEEVWLDESAIVEFDFFLSMNRRDGTFGSTRTEARNGGSTRAAEDSKGPCSRVADPRPAAKF